jgi:hypothetical protein
VTDESLGYLASPHIPEPTGKIRNITYFTHDKLLPESKDIFGEEPENLHVQILRSDASFHPRGRLMLTAPDLSVAEYTSNARRNTYVGLPNQL